MSANLTIHYLGHRSEDCVALAKMRAQGRIVNQSGRGITLRLRSASPASLVMSGEGGHFVAALSRSRRSTPWVALLRSSDAERMRPWLEGSRSRPWLRRLMSGADALIVPSDSAANAWKRWLPEAKERVFRVYPYLDGAFYQAEPRAEARSPIRVSLRGGGRSRPELGVFRSVLDSFLQRCPELRTSIEITARGTWSAQDSAWAQRVGLKLQSKIQDEGDLVVLVDPGSGADALPVDFFSVLRSGRPILSLSASREAQELLARVGLGLHVDCSQYGWAERGACVIQRAVFRRALKRGLLAEYAPRPGALAEFSPQSYCDAVEAICRQALHAPKRLPASPVEPQITQAQALGQRIGE